MRDLSPPMSWVSSVPISLRGQRALTLTCQLSCHSRSALATSRRDFSSSVEDGLHTVEIHLAQRLFVGLRASSRDLSASLRDDNEWCELA